MLATILEVPIPNALIALSVIAISALFVRSILPGDRSIDLPGPRGWPIFGSWFDLGDNWAEHFRQAAKTYGDVRQSFETIYTFLIRADTVCFDFRVLSKSSAFTIGTSPWNESTANKRKAAATALNRPAVQSYLPIIRQESLDAIRRILKDGEGGRKGIVPYAYFQRLALNTNFQVNYGFRMEERDDGLFEEIAEVIAKVASVRAVTGSLQDYVPIMRYFPAKSQAAASYGLRRKKFMDKLYDELEQRIAQGKDEICITMIWTIGYLAKHPSIQHKAHSELVTHNPSHQLPDVSSPPQFPYIHAIAKEASRLFTVFRISLPRTNVRSVVYGNTTIPSGTTFLLNSWACNLDASRFPSPMEFRPERFLQSHGVETYSFGVGRRSCPGAFLALQEIYTTLVFLIHFFEIEPEGEFEIDPLTAVEDGRGFSVRPRPFRVRCVVREGVDLSPLGDAE
ncbi:cytochrome P450 [Pseudozyma hubeiensis SY62]|uniref:Cytochrome P450 n=1 Tax=Pseudozyma hubeiensis (strain SY62) TaxID=1305764 RepID=R9P361_PSEHS|nr:cytochrome P450 [Pseudozyma hubeiensis SY62]GAC95697.1 cytochrome P450 [Pseudozyma hubeiensis SY62]